MNPEVTEQPMRVVADITRRDVFVVVFRYMLRARWMWGLCALGFAACLGSQWHSESSPSHWLCAVSLVVVLGVIGLALLIALALLVAVITVVQVSAQCGVLGSHTFEIRDEGFFESTSVNQTLTSWSAIACVIRTDHSILVSLTGWLFHCIPRRAFADAAACDTFLNALQQRIGRSA